MAGVNRVLGQRLLDDVDQRRREDGTTFLFVEHDMDVVMTRADRVIVMAEGAVIAEGPPDAIRADQRVIDAYLGKARSR
jgi:branched-chain amino acid transport system ATP-binding protein